MATYNAQNIGARKLDRVRQGFNSAHIIGITYAIVTGVIIFFFGKYLSYLFISDNAAEVIPMVDTYVKLSWQYFSYHFILSMPQEWYPGHGIRAASNACRCCRTGRDVESPL